MLKEETNVKCVICHGDKINMMEVKEEYSIGNDIVYIPITVPVCKTCGERYYDRRTMQFLEKTEENLLKNKPSLKEIGKILIYEDAHINS